MSAQPRQPAFDQASMQAAIRQWQATSQGLSQQLTLAPVANVSSVVTPFNALALPTESVTEADAASVADEDTRCIILCSGTLTTKNGRLQVPGTKRYEAPFKATGAKPNLKLVHTNAGVKEGLEKGKLMLFGGKLMLKNFQTQHYQNYRVYANIKAREGELGYNEGTGFVYAKISASDLYTNNGMMKDVLICDHTLSDDDAAMMRIMGPSLLPEKADSQYADIGTTHKLVPENSPVFRKYKNLGHPDLPRVNKDLALVVMGKPIFNDLAPGTKKMSAEYYTQVKPNDLELTVVPEPRLDEKGEAVDADFWSPMRKAPKNATERANEGVHIEFNGEYMCHTCPCEDAAPDAATA